MKTLFLLLGVVVCVTYATELADLASDQYEARIIEEWSACSQFCVDNCKARYGVEQYSLCFEYACGCKVLTQEPEQRSILRMTTSERTYYPSGKVTYSSQSLQS